MFSNFVDRYVVTSCGKVYDKKLGRFLPQQVNRDGYCKITLRSEDGSRKTFSVHRLVCWKYLKNPEDKETVNHKNGIKADNLSTNLEWATRSEQVKHAWDNGLIKDMESRVKAVREANSKPVRCIETGEVFLSLTAAADKYNIHKSNISAACRSVSGYRSAGKLENGTKLTWRFENDNQF